MAEPSDPRQTADDAVSGLRAACARRPADPRAFLELGDLLGRLGRYDDAAAVFEEGLALEPRAIVLRVGLGYVHLGRGDRGAARDQFQRVREAAPERYDGLVGMGHVLALDGDHRAAIDLYRRALDLQPDNAATRISLAKCLLEQGERAAGEAELRIAVGGSAEQAWPAILALSGAPHGRLVLNPQDMARALGVAQDNKARKPEGNAT
jgi:tetratricopeptide (TPR) repeat protein